MTSLYKDKDLNSLGLTEDHGQVELDFHDLFDYSSYCDESTAIFQGEEQDEAGSAAGTGYHPCANSDTEGLMRYEEQAYAGPSRLGAPALSPRIEITLSHEQYHQGRGSLGVTLPVSPGHSLPVPRHEGGAYREPACASPASSNSSTSWHSESLSPWPSPCVSPVNSQMAADLCAGFQAFHPCGPATGSPHTSPVGSPRTGLTEDSCRGPRSPSPHPGSRSSSPKGKRTHEMRHSPTLSRSPSPQGGAQMLYHANVHDTQAGLVQDANDFENDPLVYTRTKVSKTLLKYPVYAVSQLNGSPSSTQQELRAMSATESCYNMPSTWSAPFVQGICSLAVASVSPLEWAVPSRQEPYELRVEVQPKAHHRAHYETEGSRGAVKAPAGSHPVVQLYGYSGHDPLWLQIFIGTADERVLKPHAFYQVHRITGKTVNAVSYEKVIHGTKVLEIPLEPVKNMAATIDCVGILKLKNADIEQRKGETDIGRKNTCVRLVFRVHIPQPGGHHIALQVASETIECSQRSAHELPMVDKQDIESCSVLGGQQMILTGQNFTSDSKVVFTEKTHEGHQIWKAEATVDKGKCQADMLFVEIPSYRDPSIVHPVKVNYFVINGKKKRSLPQDFTYTPLPVQYIKTEPVDHLCGQMTYAAPHMYYQNPSSRITAKGGLVGGAASQYQPCTTLPRPDPCLQQLIPAIAYGQGGRSPGTSPVIYQQLGTAAAPPDAHHPVLVHAGSPALASRVGSSAFQVVPAGHLLSAPGPVLEQRSTAPLTVACATVTQPQAQSYIQMLPRGRQHTGHTPPASCPLPVDPKAAAARSVTIKQENLDQADLDDVNDIIRNDLTVQKRSDT